MRRLVVAIGLISLGLAGGLSLLASEAPDGLEHSLEQVGAREGQPVVAAPMPDYEAPFLSQPQARRVVAGLSGALVVMGVVTALGWLLRRAGRPRRPGL